MLEGGGRAGQWPTKWAGKHLSSISCSLSYSPPHIIERLLLSYAGTKVTEKLPTEEEEP